uniref:Uncharacterized protein n=1 Tax=Timema monikensis TaxID=170555 RepID=A0A7R9E318_9NEOP|nr:unnamed protein product [Timema monikensis]
MMSTDHRCTMMVSIDHRRTMMVSTDHRRTMMVSTDHRRTMMVSTDHRRTMMMSTDHRCTMMVSTDHRRTMMVSTDCNSDVMNLNPPDIHKYISLSVGSNVCAVPGVGSPRAMSVTGKPLPSPRLISVSVHPDTSKPHVRYSLMFMQFAQILDHDLTHTPVNKGFVGESILDCQPCDAMETVHPECFPIPVPEGDPYFPRVNISTGKPTCIPVTRSMPGQLTLAPDFTHLPGEGSLSILWVWGPSSFLLVPFHRRTQIRSPPLSYITLPLSQLL